MRRYYQRRTLNTPERAGACKKNSFEGYHQKVEDVMTVFENESEGIDQIVGLNDIEFYSFVNIICFLFWESIRVLYS